MRAYFIGGSLDLSCREVPEDHARFWFTARLPPIPPLTMTRLGEDFPLYTPVIKERYRSYHIPDQAGNEIAIFVYDGEVG